VIQDKLGIRLRKRSKYFNLDGPRRIQIQLQVSTKFVGEEILSKYNLEKAVFWDIKAQFLPHRKHYISATESSR
jgi:hypothetical protein